MAAIRLCLCPVEHSRDLLQMHVLYDTFDIIAVKEPSASLALVTVDIAAYLAFCKL